MSVLELQSRDSLSDSLLTELPFSLREAGHCQAGRRQMAWLLPGSGLGKGIWVSYKHFLRIVLIIFWALLSFILWYFFWTVEKQDMVYHFAISSYFSLSLRKHKIKCSFPVSNIVKNRRTRDEMFFLGDWVTFKVFVKIQTKDVEIKYQPCLVVKWQPSRTSFLLPSV